MRLIFWIKENYIVSIIVVIASILRLYHIDFQSVWLDEIHTINEASPNKSFSEVYNALLISEPHPPLYFFIMHVLFKIFGYTSFVARIFSALLGISGVISIFFLGKEMFNKRVGIYAMILVTINYFQLYYSQDARMYPMLFLTTTVSFIYLIKFIKSPSYKSAIGYALLSVLMIYSHFFALFVLVSQYLILLFFIINPFVVKRKQFFIYTFVSGIITLLLYLPTYNLILRTKEIKSFWIQMPTLDVYTQYFKDFFGQSELVLFFIVALIILFFLQLFKQKNTKNLSINPNEDKLIFSFFIIIVWILTTLLLPLIRTYTNLPMLVNRYFISILPAIILLVAIGLNYIKNEVVRYLMLFIIVVFSITDIVVVKKYYNVPNKTQFREVTNFIKQNNKSHDEVITSLGWYFPYFLNNDSIKNKISEYTLDNYVNEMINDSTKKKSFWYVDAHNRPYNVSEQTQKYLEDNFSVTNNIDLYDTWTKHYEKSKSGSLLKKDISKYLPLKPINGDEIKSWIDKYDVNQEYIELFGWSYLSGIDANASKIELVLVSNEGSYLLPSQSAIRNDITKSVNNEFNLDNSGFSAKVLTSKIPKGIYKLAILINNQKQEKEGLCLTDKVFEKK